MGWREENARPSNSLRINLSQPNASNLPLLHQLPQNGDRLLNTRIGILPRTLKNINLLLPIQHPQTLIHRAPNVLLRSIRKQLSRFQPTLDTQHHLVRLLGVLRKIGMQEMQRVEVGGTVEFTGVPEVGAMGESCVEGFEALGLRGWRGVPG